MIVQRRSQFIEAGTAEYQSTLALFDNVEGADSCLEGKKLLPSLSPSKSSRSSRLWSTWCDENILLPARCGPGGVSCASCFYVISRLKNVALPTKAWEVGVWSSPPRREGT
jgi:hypothetical protein